MKRVKFQRYHKKKVTKFFGEFGQYLRAAYFVYEKTTPFKERNNKGFVTFNKDFRKKYDPRAPLEGYQYSVFFKMLGKLYGLNYYQM